MPNLTRLLLSRYGVRFYQWCRKAQDKAATSAFSHSVASVGVNCVVHHPFYLEKPQYIHVGTNFYSRPGLRIEAVDTYFDETYAPEIVIGDNVCLNFHVHIGALGRLHIGNNVLVGSHVLITDHSHGNLIAEEIDVPPISRPLTTKGEVVIEDNVWIGEGVCILSGVHIGSNAVIGANAVVTHDVAPGQVVAGIPAHGLSHLRTPRKT